MSIRKELLFFISVVAAALLWMPVAAWLMPRITNAPFYGNDPSWYWSSTALGIFLAYGLRGWLWFRTRRFAQPSAK